MEPTVFRRQMGHQESVLYDFLEHGSLNIVYNLTLLTNVKINECIMMTSLKCMYNLFPMLRMSIVKSDGEVYFKEMESGTIDYERVEGDRFDHYNDLLNMKFNKEGPLWRVRLLDKGEQKCETKPFVYDLLISWTHSITDGTSCIRMCNRLAEIIDATLEGETVNGTNEVEIKPPIEELLSQKEYTWSEVKPLLEKRMKQNHGCTLWGKVFPANKDRLSKALIVGAGFLDETTTKKLIKRCKEENVTVNGVLTAAINIAVYKSLKSGGAVGDTLQISSVHYVNLRRFLQDKDICGYAVGSAHAMFNVTGSSQADFWETAREASSIIHTEINSEDFLKEIATVSSVLLNGKQIIASNMDNPITYVDYGFSNMLDVKREFSGVYRNLSVDWISLSTSDCYFGVPCCFNAITFRGRLLFSADCDTRYMTVEQGNVLVEDALAIMKSVAQDARSDGDL